MNPDIRCLAQPLTLPCGQVLPNRMLKSAMSETLGTPEHAPTERHERLYRRWADGGVGLSITGNVMVDPGALGEPGNVVLEDERHLDAFRRWATAGKAPGTRLWMQLNHPGKQAPRFLNAETVSASAIGFGKALEKAFGVPRALTEPEIEALILRFGRSGALAKQAGFEGVQIHGAHGYLVAQFLSPRHNQREDGWGGSLENRARFVREVQAELRRQVGPDFPVGIKINSADFQRGGFSEEDSTQVIRWLAEDGIDLVEVSGGTYEAPAMVGPRKASTEAREGYFLDFVERLRQEVQVPLAVTGGFRSAAGLASAVGSGSADLVGLARTLAIQPDFPRHVLAGEDPKSLVGRPRTGVRAIDSVAMLDVTWYEVQLARMGAGKAPLPTMSAWRALLQTGVAGGTQAFRMRRTR